MGVMGRERGTKYSYLTKIWMNRVPWECLVVLSFKVSSYRYLKIVLKALACHGLKLRTALHLMGRQFCALWQSCSITSYPSCEYLMGGKLKTFLAAIVNYARVWKDCYVLRYCMQKKLSIYLAQKKKWSQPFNLRSTTQCLSSWYKVVFTWRVFKSFIWLQNI